MINKTLLTKDLIDQKSNNFDSLIKYSLNTNKKYLVEIEGFFNKLKEGSAILQSENLYNTSEKFNKLINIYNSGSLNKRDLVLEITKLYGEAYKTIEKLNKDLKCTKIEKQCDYEQIKGNNNNGKSILIIDDDILILSVLEGIFTDAGYNVVLSSNPLSVISTIKDKHIDLVILDMIMPKMNGIDLIKLIKKTDPGLPIFILSANSDSENKIKALDIGADDYITKPFVEDELIARADRAIDRSLKYKAGTIIDWLTGTYMKNYFWKKADEYKNQFNRSNRKFSIAFIDLDNFKLINDTHGHLVGDEILRSFAQDLKKTLRNTDQIFRFGGDEFVVLFPETDVQDAHNIIERFRISVNNNKSIKKNLCPNIEIELSFSAGITEIQGIKDNIKDAINRADKALYTAKKYGRNKICSYENMSSCQYKHS